jgi:3-oxoacyl-[acyl-carrier protein] reductase
MELAGCVALVTGAAGTIGGAVAQRFAREGARLVLADEDAAALARLRQALAGAVERMECEALDTASDRAMRALVQRTVDRFGGIDVLVNALGAPEESPWDEPGPGTWERRLRTLTACAVCCRAVAPEMVARRRGRIVNVAATAGRYRSAYFRPDGAAGSGLGSAAAGGGVLALTRELAMELGPQGVTVNAVVPGWILGERSSREWEALSDGVRRDILAEISLGRPGRPEEVAGAVLFLAADASSYVSGCAIDVNGGWWMS